MNSSHGLIYSRSRCGKTTFAASFHKPEAPLWVVTREPGPAKAGLDEAKLDVPITVPQTPEELFVLLEYPLAYLDKHLNGYRPGTILFDNLRPFQVLIIGEPEAPEREVAGIKIPKQTATGIMRLPNSRDAGAPGLPALKDYRTLDRQTRRLVTAIDQLPFHTIITAHEDIGYDARTRLDTSGMDPKQAAARKRTLKGFPSLEGFEIRDDLPGLVSHYFFRLSEANDVYTINAKQHVDSDGINWFADARGLKLPSSTINWTNKSAYDILLGGR